jgi:hypothetical protein
MADLADLGGLPGFPRFPWFQRADVAGLAALPGPGSLAIDAPCSAVPCPPAAPGALDAATVFAPGPAAPDLLPPFG